MHQDPDTDDCIWCDVCGEPKRKLNYRMSCGVHSAVWMCERCEAEEDAEEEAVFPNCDAAKAVVGKLSEAEALAAADALQADFERDMQASFEAAMSPNYSKSGIFRDHGCWKCSDGERPCVEGRPGGCSYPRARND